MLIGFLQNLHFAIKKIKDKTGILSNHLIFFLQYGQYDRPVVIGLFFGRRYMQTFAKLPQAAPSKTIIK